MKRICLLIIVMSVIVMACGRETSVSANEIDDQNINVINGNDYMSISDNHEEETVSMDNVLQTEQFVFYSPTNEDLDSHPYSTEYSANLLIDNRMEDNSEELARNLADDGLYEIVFKAKTTNGKVFLDAFANTEQGINLTFSDTEQWTFNASNFYVSSLDTNGIDYIIEHSPAYNPLHAVETGVTEKGNPYLITERMIYNVETDDYTKEMYAYYEDFGTELNGYKIIAMLGFERSDCSVEELKEYASEVELSIELPDK